MIYIFITAYLAMWYWVLKNFKKDWNPDSSYSFEAELRILFFSSHMILFLIILISKFR